MAHQNVNIGVMLAVITLSYLVGKRAVLAKRCRCWENARSVTIRKKDSG